MTTRSRTAGRQALEDSALQALYDISVLAADGRNEPAMVAEVTAEQARRLLAFEAAAIFAWNEALGLLEPIYETAGSDREPPMAAGQGMVGEVYRTSRPLAVTDYQEYPGRVPTSAARGMRSAIAVPMLLRGRPIGVLGVWSYRRREIGDDDVRLLSLFATQVAPAFEAARSFSRTKARRDSLQALQDVAMAIAGLQDPLEVAQLSTRIAADLLGADRAYLLWHDADTGRLVPLAQHNPFVSFDWTIEPGQGAGGIAFATRAPVVITDYPRWEHAEGDAVTSGVQSIMAVPLVVRDRALGAIAVTTRQQRRFAAADTEMLSLFASLVAPDLEIAQLLERSERQVRDLTALQETAVAVSGLLDPTALARLTVDTARDLLGVDSAVLRWFEPERGTLRLLATNDPHQSQLVPEIAADQGVIGAAFTRRAPQRVDHYGRAPERLPWVAEDGVQTALAVPLLAGDRAIGALAVATYREHAYDPRDLALLTSFAALAGPALEAARLTAAQAAHEAELRSVYAAMACGVVVWDGEGNILELNETGAALFGLRPDQLDGRMPAEIAGFRRLNELEQDVAWEDRPMEAARRTGRPVRNAVVGYQKPGGGVIWLQFDCVPMLDGDGRVRRVIGSFIDIGAVKGAEAARRESEAKSRFVAAMSHELRTPLNSILGFTQLLRGEEFGPLTERQRRYVEHIANSGQHLLALVNDVLDLSKVVAGQLEFATEPVDVERVVEEVLAGFRPLAGGRHLALRGTPAAVAAHADRRRVQQVLHNLVSNAIKFTDGSGYIEVEVKKRRREVVVGIHDSGIGIPADQHDRIFEEFTQVDDSRSRRAEGTGLGLPLSRRLVEQMGGRLWVESKPGRGSSFFFSLPSV